jgi:integrase/recombinase XerD
VRCLIGRVFKPFWTKKGDPTRHYTEAFYCEYVDHTGKQRRKKGYKDRGATTQLLAKLERDASQARHGLKASHNHADRPLADLQAEYIATLASRGGSPAYLATVKGHLDSILVECRWHTVHDFDADQLTRWLGDRGNKSTAKVKTSRPSPATLNGYLRSVKGFGKWCQEKTDVVVKLSSVKRRPEAVDRRRSKRIPTDVELRAIVAAAEANPSQRHLLPGVDRAWLYRIAAYTGLRASELASLTPAAFSTAGKLATVHIEAKYAKAKRAATIPIHPSLTKGLKKWLKGKNAGERLWPGRWAANRDQNEWFAGDVANAGITSKDAQGRKLTFHGFRRMFITRLIRSKADIAQVKRLARHVDLKTTLDYYEESELKDLGIAVGKIKGMTT